MKNVFWKNMFNGLAAFGTIIIFELMCLLVIFYSEAPKHMVILFMIGAVLLYFAVGFYFLFQVVVIDDFGICVKILSKMIRNIPWEKVESVRTVSSGNGKVLRVIVRGEIPLTLDWRKKIMAAIDAHRPKKDEIAEEASAANSPTKEKNEQRSFFARPSFLVLQLSGAISLDAILVVIALSVDKYVGLTVLMIDVVLFFLEIAVFAFSFTLGWNAMVSIDSVGVSKRFGSEIVSFPWETVHLEEMNPRKGIRKTMRLKSNNGKSIVLERIDSIFALLETYCTNEVVLAEIARIKGCQE